MMLLRHATFGHRTQVTRLEMSLSQGTDIKATSSYLPLLYKSLSLQNSFTPFGQFSIRSNVSGEPSSSNFVVGDLTIGMNPNKTATDALLSLTMQASSSTLRKDTNVCFAMSDVACDLAIYVREVVNRLFIPSKAFAPGPRQPQRNRFSSIQH